MIREIFLRDSLLWICVWQSTIFIVVGLVGSFILRHRSSRAHQVLFLAMIAAVIVPIMSILVKNYELGVFVAESVVIQSRAEDRATMSNYGASGVILAEDIEHNLNPVEEDLPSAVASSESVRFPWRSVVLCGWLAASLILVTRLLVTFVLGLRLLGRTRPLECQKIEQALRLAKAKLGIDKDVKVRSSRSVRSPVIWCWRRSPVLLVPSAAGRFDNGVDWAGVLCHELAHWKRRDHISGLFAELVVCILPWHPLVWWAKSRLVRLSEQACDDWVVASGQPGTDYAESLLDLTPQGQMAFVPAVVRSKKGLPGRIQRILKDKCGNPRTGTIWALAVGIAAICIAIGVAFAQTRPAKTEGTKDKSYFEGSFQLGRDINVEVDAAPEGMRKIVHAKSIRFDKANSDIKVTLRADVRKGLRFEWRTKIELLGVGGIILDQRDTLNNSRSLVSGQPVVEELVIEFSPFNLDEVANARRFRIHFEQAGPLLDELGRPHDADRTDWIRGHVTGPDGKPAVDAIVLINEHKPEGEPFRVPRVGTDEKGYYRFGAVDWPYRIGAEHKRPVPSTNVDCYQILRLKRILNGPQEVDFQFHEPPKGTTSLVGRVVDTKEVPIREFTASVSIADGLRELYSEDANHADEYFVKSFWFKQEVNNEDGTFRLDNIPAGKYRIWIIPKEKQYEWHRQEVVLADNKTTNLVLEVHSKHVLYGRVLFEDGSPAVIKPEPWPGAKTRILVPLGGRARGLATVEEDGYFTAYFNETELERLKSTGSALIINVPTAQQNRSKTVGRFPFELLATEKSKAGAVKVSRPETKPLSMGDEASPAVDSRGTKQEKDNPSSEPDDKKAKKTRNVEVRVVHFPTDRSLGKLYISDPEKSREFGYWFHWTSVGERREYLCEAKGEVHVPAGKLLSLNVNKTGWKDLSWLTKLRPDDLHAIAFEYTLRYQTRATDDCMLHIARLTGLKSLVLTNVNVTDRGIRYIRNLKSLEHLKLPVRVTDRGMAYVAELTSLKRLYFSVIDGSSQVTNEGLRYLAKLTNLEELALIGERMGDAGLVHIKDLPRLEYLFIRGSHFGDNGMIHVKNISSLRMLSFHEGIAHITDAGLVHISDLPKLESLCLHAMSNITDNGLANLAKMPSLKKLEIGSSQVTDKGLEYLSQIKTLERLDLPQEQKGITDKGLTYLGQLPNLKYLSISRIHYNDPKMNKEYYTDKGLAELAKCRLLEELHIGSIGITDVGMEHIAKLTNLKMLHLFGCDNITDAGLARLTTLKSLRNLRITEADISIKGLNNFKPIPDLTKLKVYDLQRNSAVLDLSDLTALEDLSLSFRPRSQDEFVDADLMGLANLKKLKWLQIGPRNYTDKGIAYLAGLTNMERLGINGSGLTDEGLKYLTNMKKLNHLSIIGRFDANKRDFTSGGNITDKGLRHLEELKLLSFLNIYSDNTFSTAALQSLQRKLPNLVFLMINGRNALGRSNPMGMGMGQQAPSLRQSTRPSPVKQTTDRSSRFEIQIETRILLISEDFLQSFGIDENSIHDANAWSKLTPGVLAASDDLNTLGLILDDLMVSFLLRATQAHEGAKMLAAPPVTVFDGEEATVSIRKQVNYISGYSEPNRASDKPEPKHDSLTKGIELQLTPKLTPDNKNITLDVDFELSEVIGFEKRMYKEKYPYKIPQIDVVSTKTHCLFPNGKTLLIGGQNIITEEDGRKMKKKLLVLMKAEKVDSESLGAPKLGGYGGYGGYGYGPPPGPGKSEYRYNPNQPAEPNQI